MGRSQKMPDEPVRVSESATPGDNSRVYLLAFPATFEGSSPDLGRWIRLATAGWLVLSVGCAAGFLGGFTASYLARNEYSAQTVILPVEQGTPKGLLGSVLSEFGAGGAAAALGVTPSENLKTEALAYLNSAEFAQAMILKHGLFGDLFPNDWDVDRGIWRDPTDAPSINDAIKKFREQHFSCVENRTAGTITVSFLSPRRESLATVVNGMIVDVNMAMRERAIAEADRSISYLNEQSRIVTTVEVKELIYRLLESQYSRRMLAHAREDYAFRVVDPARVPDANQKVAPRRSLWAATGAFLGLSLAFVFLLRRAAAESALSKAS